MTPLWSLSYTSPTHILFPMAKTAQTTDSASSSRSSALVWWGAAALALIVGYADLWRGGDTIAPLLLVVGYCILVPVAILKR